VDNTTRGEAVIPDHGRMHHTGHYAWPLAAFQNGGYYIGVKNWKDTTGTMHDIKLTGAPPVDINESQVTMPVRNSETGNYIDRYYAHKPPSIKVDGMQLQHPKLNGDHYNAADKIPGDADVMVVSQINTDMGLKITQRAIAYDEKNYDEFAIFDYTIKNTGNVDTDDKIEKPNQTLKDLYYLRGARLDVWNSEYWYSGRGEFKEDSLRIRYAYPGRRNTEGKDWTGDSPNNLAEGHYEGWLRNVHSVGTSILHASKSADQPNVDDKSQPAMTATECADLLWLRNDPLGFGQTSTEKNYRVMSEGFEWRPASTPREINQQTISKFYSGKTVRKPNEHHVRMEDEGKAHKVKFVKGGFEWQTWGASYFWSAGPYNLEPGEEIRITFANGYGTLDPLKIWDVAGSWMEGNCEPPKEYQGDWPDNPEAAMPPPYDASPSLYNEEKNSWAKDAWVFTSIDSLLENMKYANEVEENDFELTEDEESPPAPNIEVNGLPDKVEVKWSPQEGTNASSYKVYRTTTSIYEGYIRGSRTEKHGNWKAIAEVSGDKRKYEDDNVSRGVAVYYYVAAVDEQGNESGKWRNVTTQPTTLKRETNSDLSKIRIVPNPYNIAAEDVQYPGQQDKLMFLNLPGECTIKIFSEAGDLVETINHDDGTGDEAWGDQPNNFMTSQSGQKIVSGIYIAYFETPDGKSTYKKFVIVR